MLFNNGVVPALVELSKERHVYSITTNSIDVVLFIKYRSIGKKIRKWD